MTEQVRKRIFSPLQIGASTLLAGPMAGTHLLWSNFISLGQSREAKIAAAVGISVTVALLIFSVSSNTDRHLGMLIGLILALSGRFTAEIYQMKKEAIANSTEYMFQSNWKVFCISLVWLAIMLSALLLIMFMLSLAGIDVG